MNKSKKGPIPLTEVRRYVIGLRGGVIIFIPETYLLTPSSTVPLQKLTGSQLVKKLPAIHGTRRFITSFTTARHLFLSRASSIQSIPPHPTSRRSISVLSSHLRLGLPSDFFPSGFPVKTLHTPLFSPIRATCHAHLILLDFITRKIFGNSAAH